VPTVLVTGSHRLDSASCTGPRVERDLVSGRRRRRAVEVERLALEGRVEGDDLEKGMGYRFTRAPRTGHLEDGCSATFARELSFRRSNLKAWPASSARARRPFVSCRLLWSREPIKQANRGYARRRVAPLLEGLPRFHAVELLAERAAEGRGVEGDLIGCAGRAASGAVALRPRAGNERQWALAQLEAASRLLVMNRAGGERNGTAGLQLLGNDQAA